MKLTNKPYYFTAYGQKFNSMKDFLAEWDNADDDLNLLVRYDIRQPYEEEFQHFVDRDFYVVEFCYVQPRHGETAKATVAVKEDDEQKIYDYVEKHTKKILELIK